MTKVPPQIDTHMKETLAEAIRILFPVGFEPLDIVAAHAWGNRDYVGELNDSVVVWRGWRANLSKVDESYHGVYINFVENRLSPQDRQRLFGDQFTTSIEGLPAFVVAFVGGLSHNMADLVNERGFVVRTIGRNIHACLIWSPDSFLRQPPLYWSAQIARLVNLQRALKGERPPAASGDVGHKKRPRWLDEMDWEHELGLFD